MGGWQYLFHLYPQSPTPEVWDLPPTFNPHCLSNIKGVSLYINIQCAVKMRTRVNTVEIKCCVSLTEAFTLTVKVWTIADTQ